MGVWTIISILVAGVAFAQAEGVGLECPAKNGHYGVPGDCTSYLKCFNGKGRVIRCPEGFLFDSTMHCTFPSDKPDCGFPTPEQKEINSYCQEFYGEFEHPHDCRKYVNCQEGRGTVKTCPEGFVYYKYTGCVQSDTCI